MKKLLLIAMAVMATFAVKAETKTYTDQLVVTVNESVTTQRATVNVEMLEDNYINFVLRNFVLAAGEDSEDEMYVGNIAINNLFLTDKGTYKTFTYNANLQIQNGDREDVDTWIGPMLGNVPLVLKGKLADDKLYVSIDIDMMSSLEQMIYVKFGTDFEAPEVAFTKEYIGKLTTKQLQLDEEEGDYYVPRDDNESYTTTLQTLVTGDINLMMNGVSILYEENVLPMGNFIMKEVDTMKRGKYTSFEKCGEGEIESTQEEINGLKLPYTIKGKFDEANLYYEVTLDMSSVVGIIFYYVYGTDFAPVAAAGEGKVYDDKLVVTVDEESTEPMDAHVLVTPLTNGGINFTLKNFTMVLGGNEMHVGNIEIADLKLYEDNGYQYFNYSNNLTIVPGDEEGVDESDYIGPLLGEIPLRMRGRMTDERLFVVIDIDMEVGGAMQVIHVEFGTSIGSGIQGVNENSQFSILNSQFIYDLSGRRISVSSVSSVNSVRPKGIFIVNGKKIIR